MILTQLKNSSLKHMLLKRIVLIGVIVVIATLFVDYVFVVKQENEKLANQFTYIEETILENLTNSVWTLNKPIVQLQIDSLTTLDYVSYVEVFEGDQIFVSSNTKKPEDNGVISKRYDLIFELDNQKIPIGYMMIVADTSNIYQNALYSGSILIISNALLVVLLMYFAISFLNKNLFSHLEKISQFMKDSAHNDLYEEFHLDRNSGLKPNDELDHLVDAFNFRTVELASKNKELKLSQEKFYKIFQSSVDAIIITCFDKGVIMDVNQSFYRLYEFQESDEIIGKTTSELNIWSETENRGDWKKRLLQEKAVYLHETKYKKKSGVESDCVISAQIIDFIDIVGLVWVVRDISKTKRFEKEILKSQRRLHNLARNQEEIRENERMGIAREIHDELGQSFTGLKIDLSWLKKNLSDACHSKIKIDKMIENIDTSVDIVRRISSQLRPSVLDDLGLIAAIEWLTQDLSQRTDIRYQLNIQCHDLTLSKERDTAIFRIYQEALTNIVRHSQANNFTVTLQLIEDDLVLKVIDDGIGISEEQINSDESIGIIGMQERAANIGATVMIDNHEPQGTQVTLVSPIGLNG